MHVLSHSLYTFLLAVLLAGCGSSSGRVTEGNAESLTPESAKAALLVMMRSEAGQKVSWFQGGVPEEMAKLPVRAEEAGWFSWSAFRLNPSQRAYTLLIQPRHDARACVFEGKGSFTQEGGRWIASAPEMISAGLQQGKD